MVEGEERDSTTTESTLPLRTPEAEHSTECGKAEALPLSSDDPITVSLEEEQMLMDDSALVTGGMAELNVPSPRKSN